VKHRLLPATEARRQAPAHRMPVVGIVVACDHERFIGSLVLSLRSHVDELIVVDDGSRDDTGSIARYAGATVLEHETHRGRIAAVNTGLHYVQGSHPATVLVIDGEYDYCEGDIPGVLTSIEAAQSDVVLGVRASVEYSAETRPHPANTDARSTLYGLSSRVVEELRFAEQGASFEHQFLEIAKREGWRVAMATLARPERKKRTPVARWERTAFGNFVRLIGEDRPLLFFGLSGMLVFILGCLLGVYVTRIYAETNTLAVGYGLLTVLLCVVGTVLFFAGIILHSTRSMMTELSRSLQLQGVGKELPTSFVAMPGDEIVMSEQGRTVQGGQQ
jgi:glycosyltransferase involved in cell wall biosynthesis